MNKNDTLYQPIYEPWPVFRRLRLTSRLLSRINLNYTSKNKSNSPHTASMWVELWVNFISEYHIYLLKYILSQREPPRYSILII